MESLFRQLKKELKEIIWLFSILLILNSITYLILTFTIYEILLIIDNFETHPVLKKIIFYLIGFLLVIYTFLKPIFQDFMEFLQNYFN